MYLLVITLAGKMRKDSVILAFFTVVAIRHKFFHFRAANINHFLHNELGGI
jgi:hypothetical protein